MYIKHGYAIDNLSLSEHDIHTLNELYARYSNLGNSIKDADEVEEFLKFVFKGEPISIYEIEDEFSDNIFPDKNYLLLFNTDSQSFI